MLWQPLVKIIIGFERKLECLPNIESLDIVVDLMTKYSLHSTKENFRQYDMSLTCFFTI